jgi:hypothetical protein
MSLDNNSIFVPWYTGFSTVPPQTISSEIYPYVLRDNDQMFQTGINFLNWNPYITHSGSEAVTPDIDHGCVEYPPSLIWQFGAGLLIVFISIAGAIISYSLGSKI